MSIESSIPLPPVPPMPVAANCTLCDTELDHEHQRCSACGLYQELGPEKPTPFQHKSLWLLIGVMLTVYLAVLAIVAVIPANK